MDTIAQEATGVQTLPESWEWAAYGELGEWSGGGTPSKSNPSYWEDGEIPWFSPKDMHGLELQDSQDHITEGALQGSAAKLIRAGSLLFVVRSGILRRTLPVALTAIDGAVNQDIKALTPSKSLSTKYLLYATLAQKEEIRHRCKKAGTTVESIQVAALQKYRLPIAPLNEQRRIVEKIEELFTKLDAGIRSLEQARAQLKSYRRSVLKAAVEGELSREWREAHKDELEPASELLERILQERREKFAGKKYKDPTPPVEPKLIMIPDGWEWARLDSLASIKGGITKDSKRSYQHSRDVPYLRVANVQRGYLDLSELKEIEASEDVIEQLLLQSGDVLFTEGGDRDKLGRGWIWNGEVAECIHQNHIFRARLYSADVEPKLVSWFGNTFGQVWFMEQGKQTTNLASINLTKLSAFPVPLPPLKEQRFIVEEVERRLSVVDKLEETVEASLKQANALRQSILERAFSGELVPQDPDDEPAGVLLERIRSERQKTGLGRRARRTKVDDGEQERLI